MKHQTRFALPALLLCAVILPVRLAAENVTWYKIRSDENGKPSWTKSYDGSHGWATDPAATAADVRFKLLDSSKGGLHARNDGLYLTQGLSVIVR